MRRLNPAILILFSIASLSLSGTDFGGRCTGSAYCRACSSCSACKHCNDYGGTCGVCASSTKSSKTHYSSRSYLSSSSDQISYGRVQAECKSFKKSFESYAEAINYVRAFPFDYQEAFNITNSSWMKRAEWYSCTGAKGYFIFITLAGKDYIHQGVPANIWKAFKETESKGSYYDAFIKGRYRFTLNN